MGGVAKMRGGAGVKLLSYCDGEAPGGRSLCVLNCHPGDGGPPALIGADSQSAN